MMRPKITPTYEPNGVRSVRTDVLDFTLHNNKIQIILKPISIPDFSQQQRERDRRLLDWCY